MQFKIKSTTYKISFTFLALVLIAITTGNNKNFLLFLIFAIAHELVHLFFIFRLSVAPERVVFSVFGANISRKITATDNINSEIIINASAPVFNIITGAFFQLFSAFEVNKDLFYEISIVNYSLGIFNLIPLYTFDGGNVLRYILLKFINEKITENLLTAISLLVTIIFSFISVYIFLNYQQNFSLFIICIYMFFSIIFKKQNSLDY